MSSEPSPVIDLILVYGEERTMTMMLDSEAVGPVPAAGAFTPFAKVLTERYPEEYPTERDAVIMLTSVHFVLMHRGENRVGQAYPLRLGPHV